METKRLLALVLCVALCLAMGMEGCRADSWVGFELPWVWWKFKGNDLQICYEVKNFYDETIDAVDFAIYGENAYGEAMYPDDGKEGYIRFYTCDITIKPGKSKKSGYLALKGLKSAKKIYVAFHRCHFKDGTTKEFVDYSKTGWKNMLDFWGPTLID